MFEMLSSRLSDIAVKNTAGTLTYGETIQYGFYMLLDGTHAGRIVIKCSAKIDNISVSYFADRMTWIYTNDLKDVRCKIAAPSFDSCCDEYRFYRVFAVTTNADALDAQVTKNNLNSSDFEISQTAHTYCSPTTVFWLLEDGLEDPNSAIISLHIIAVRPGDLRRDKFMYVVEFEYDGGRYTGILTDINPNWGNGIQCSAMIYDISSL